MRILLHYASLFFASRKIMHNKRFLILRLCTFKRSDARRSQVESQKREKNWRTFGEIINLRESNHSPCRWLHESNISITNRCIYEQPEKLLLVVQTKNVSRFRTIHSCKIQRIQKLYIFFQITPIRSTYPYKKNQSYISFISHNYAFNYYCQILYIFLFTCYMFQ